MPGNTGRELQRLRQVDCVTLWVGMRPSACSPVRVAVSSVVPGRARRQRRTDSRGKRTGFDQAPILQIRPDMEARQLDQATAAQRTEERHGDGSRKSPYVRLTSTSRTSCFSTRLRTGRPVQPVDQPGGQPLARQPRWTAPSARLDRVPSGDAGFRLRIRMPTRTLPDRYRLPSVNEGGASLVRSPTHTCISTVCSQP